MPEGPRQRRAFDRYLQLGPERTIAHLHAALTEAGLAPPTERTLYEWSRRYGWQHRLQDLEREAREAEHAAQVLAYREMAERQAKEGLLLQQTGLGWLHEVENPSAGDAVRAIADGAKLERLARGAPTERIEEQEAGDPRLERFTDAELTDLAQHAARTLDGDAPPPSG